MTVYSKSLYIAIFQSAYYTVLILAHTVLCPYTHVILIMADARLHSICSHTKSHAVLYTFTPFLLESVQLFILGITWIAI